MTMLDSTMTSVGSWEPGLEVDDAQLAAASFLARYSVDFDYRRPCQGLFEHKREVEHFLAEVLGEAYHRERDLGIPMSDTAVRWCELHPDYSDQIRAFTGRLHEMWIGPVPGSAEILADLHRMGTPIYGLSNWGPEMWPLACQRFPFLEALDGVLISGHVGITKPDPEIYQLFCAQFGINASEAVFIDDIAANVDASRTLGFHGIVFRDAASLRSDLQHLELL
jgi:2-haloacid dehalogenase